MPPSKRKNKDLPPEITEEILCRLPAKTLGRFKSVSKTWRSLISDPRFIKSHINNKQCHQTTTKLILVSYSHDTLHLVDLNDNNIEILATAKQLTLGSVPIYWEKVLGFCNGLVLAKDKRKIIFLMNPTTKELWELPGNAFGPPQRKVCVKYGFGYVPSTNDYKVVMLSFSNHNNAHSNVSLYSLRNNTWRKLHNACYGHDISHLVNKCVLVNQHLHWLRRGYSSAIFAFSLESEEFNEIKVPCWTENNIHMICYKLLDLGGKLGVLFNVGVSDDFVWVMEEYGVFESWIKFCKCTLEMMHSSPFCLVEGSNRNIVLADEDKLVVYNIDKERCVNVRIEGGPNGFEIEGTYVESLESPNYRFITTP